MLLRYINEHLASYQELWKRLDQQLSTSEVLNSDAFFTTLATDLRPDTLQTKLLNKQLLYVELKFAAPRTLLFYHSQSSTALDRQGVACSAALLAALDACKNVLNFVPVNVQWLIDASGTKVNLEELGIQQPDGYVWYYEAETGLESDEHPILATGTRGYLQVELEVQTASDAIRSTHGGIAPNALWRLLWALGSLKDAHEDILIEGFDDALIPVQDDVIAQLRALPDTTRELIQSWRIQQPLMGLQGFQLHYAHLLLPTCTVSSVKSDTLSAKTLDERAEILLPGQAKAVVDFYLVPDQEPQDIFEKLQRHLQRQGFSDVQARILSASCPLRTSVSNPFVQLAISATQKAYGQDPYILPTTVGSYVDLSVRAKDEMPIIFCAKNEQKLEKDPIAFASLIKQLVLLIESMAHGTDTTE